MQKPSAIQMIHQALERHLQPGCFCIDATCGNGKDTLFLAELAGSNGRVLAFDIQQAAVEKTKQLLAEKNAACQVEVLQKSHCTMENYAETNTVDAIVFNFGYLPGGDHTIATKADTSVAAIKQGLSLLKPGGIMGLCVYQGGDTGFAEKDAILDCLAELDYREYLVVLCSFYNHHNAPPIPILIFKH